MPIHCLCKAPVSQTREHISDFEYATAGILPFRHYNWWKKVEEDKRLETS